MDVEPTAEVIIGAAEVLKAYARQLERTAAQMRETGDISYAAEALGSVLNAVINCRLDLLITRPLRETMKKPDTQTEEP